MGEGGWKANCFDFRPRIPHLHLNHETHVSLREAAALVLGPPRLSVSIPTFTASLFTRAVIFNPALRTPYWRVRVALYASHNDN